MGTTTQLVLDDRLAKMVSSGGEYIEFDTTTNITTNTSIISTTLQTYDHSRNDHFNGWWVYITEGNNIGVEREVANTDGYLTASGTLYVEGAALSAETGAVTCRLYKYRRTDAINAINDAIRETHSKISQPIEDRTLITGNILPDSSFENWSSATALTFYTATNITLAETTTGGVYRGQRGTTSAKCTASAANGYIYISSDSYPRLLDLMGQTVDFKAWAYPETADDAYLVIYTIQADGTEQTLTSTTSNPAGQWTLLELEDQAINDDIVEIQFRFKVATSGDYVYFDSARVNGIRVSEYLLPDSLQNGSVGRVYIQAKGWADDACDDLNPYLWSEDFNHSITGSGTYQYLNLDHYPSNRQIKIIGKAPLSVLTADTSTIETDDEDILMPLLCYAAFSLLEKQYGFVSSDDVSPIAQRMMYWRNKYDQLSSKLDKNVRTVSLHLPTW